jgi:hypothetical protein
MSINAKTILKDKFWIIEDNGRKMGTLTVNDENRYMYSCAEGTAFFDNKTQLNKTLGKINWSNTTISPSEQPEDNVVYGLPTSTKAFNTMYDIKRKLALFTKSAKSKSIYCAGYFIIRFEKGWVRSFCPKLITIERYGYEGPFKTDIEMRTALSKANAK